ncbi:MAG TPA: T9SS type A sorting domain-containing protein, partial [Bacteroidota bacterium]|nr:T9SS type A sorting domain-containing protein [Bacteroidota bacterium]
AAGSAIVSQLWFKETGRGFSPRQLDGSLPTAYTLEQNYPNPFNPSTVIRYAVPADGSVSLKVYDIAGREVATLVNDHQAAGTYELRFSGQNSSGRALASGVYFYQIKSGGFSETRKMLLLK